MQLLLFNRSNLNVKSLVDRKHEIDISIISNLDCHKITDLDSVFCKVARNIIQAKLRQRAIILMIGAHVIRSGVQNYLIDLIRRGYISCIAMNGAGMIHDYEFALIGATTENVAKYIKKGEFGLWKETAQLNNIINKAYSKNKTIGMGEAVGYYIENNNLPHRSISVLASAYRFNIPVTVHVSIGYDIIHQHPNCDGAATGALSYNDFLRFVSMIQKLQHGVIMNFGSSVMAPEVFLKALNMARNIAHHRNKIIKHFTSLVCDLVNLPDNIRDEPPRDDPVYYFRPLKTMLIRTIANNGESYYVRGLHAQTIPNLWMCINQLEKEIGKNS